ncbi:MAG TPA: VapC toxin family PIN domain ribonuclease [Cytophagales bacterium]|nr:VapC toxin family PIN domain ribonuclease [Cytophagales bacterium]
MSARFEINGVELVVDTNVLINLAEGKPGLDQYVNGNRLYVSSITEIELLGWYKITKEQVAFFTLLLSDCKIVGLKSEVKKLAIGLKQKQKVRLPDAIIAATSLYLDLPLVTYDSGFEKIKNENLILLS